MFRRKYTINQNNFAVITRLLDRIKVFSQESVLGMGQYNYITLPKIAHNASWSVLRANAKNTLPWLRGGLFL